MALSGRRFHREHPTEPGVSFEFVTIGFMSKAHAKQVRQQEQFGNIRAMGGEVFQALTTADPDKVKAQATVESDPNDSFDTYIILSQGIVGWSYPEPLTPEAIAKLDEPTAEWAKREILAASDVAPLVSASSSPSTPHSPTPPTPMASYQTNGYSPASVPSLAVSPT